jgi:hypothetical protein
MAEGGGRAGRGAALSLLTRHAGWHRPPGGARAPAPPRRRRSGVPVAWSQHPLFAPILPASARLGTLVFALPRAPSTPAGRSHTRSKGAGHGGHEEGALLGAPGVAVHLQKDPCVLGVPAPGLWGQRGRTPRRTPGQNHWHQPLGAPRVHGVHRRRRSARPAHSTCQV